MNCFRQPQIEETFYLYSVQTLNKETIDGKVGWEGEIQVIKRFTENKIN